jgi:purine-binding chemotaxis protein CheW
MADNSDGQIVVFSLGGEDYALPITQVQEIIRYTEPRAVASASHWILGVISLRGKIIPVCDLGARLGLPTEHPSTGNIVVVESGNVTAGIVVDEVDQVLTVEAGQLVPVPVVGSDAMKSIVKIGDRLVVLLDSDAVFHGADLAGPVTAAAA